MYPVTDYDFGISAIDSGFGRPFLDAIHLIVDGGRAAIIDTGTQASVPRVLQALAEKRVAPEQVDFVILTHIHLDHAGGAGALIAALPNAKLVVHPRGARHMIDPQRLIAGTIAVYGEEETRRMYGAIVPVPRDRVIETPHGMTLRLGGRDLLFLDTPGHAKHHVCIVDHKSGHVFAGDTFGLSYRELDRDGLQFVFPTTTPVQFDPPALHRSLELLLDYSPAAIYVTHYSQVRDVPRLAADLHRLIDAHVNLALHEKTGRVERHRRLVDGVTDILLDEARRYNWRKGRDEVLNIFAMDIELNAQGLESWLDTAP